MATLRQVWVSGGVFQCLKMFIYVGKNELEICIKVLQGSSSDVKLMIRGNSEIGWLLPQMLYVIVYMS